MCLMCTNLLLTHCVNILLIVSDPLSFLQEWCDSPSESFTDSSSGCNDDIRQVRESHQVSQCRPSLYVSEDEYMDGIVVRSSQPCPFIYINQS